MKSFNELPMDIQNEVKNDLKVYAKTNVTFENGAYHVDPGVALKAVYAPDHEFIGTYKAKDVFTEKERMLNYMESFHDYPIEYKGERDYKMLKEIERNWNARFMFDGEGNIVLA